MPHAPTCTKYWFEDATQCTCPPDDCRGAATDPTRPIVAPPHGPPRAPGPKPGDEGSTPGNPMPLTLASMNDILSFFDVPVPSHGAAHVCKCRCGAMLVMCDEQIRRREVSQCRGCGAFVYPTTKG